MKKSNIAAEILYRTFGFEAIGEKKLLESNPAFTIGQFKLLLS